MFDDWEIIPRRMAFKNFFGDMEREFVQVEDMLSRAFNTAREISTSLPSSMTNASKFPYYYGYQITVGPDGKPRIREFGNMRPSAKGLVEQANVREPLIDTSIDEKNNLLIITAEMPGISKEDIKLNLSEKYITLHAEHGDKKYHSEIPIDLELDETSAKATYTNGILELKIKRKVNKSKGKEIKIE